VLEELQIEQRSQVQESEDRQSLERSFLGEVERLQREVEQAKQGADMSVQCSESLKREVGVQVESAASDHSRLLYVIHIHSAVSHFMLHNQSFVVLQVQSLEAVIADKKRQVERLVAEMKEANLESLAIAPADEVKHLLEGGFFCA
jgi:Ras association domain-containing protein 7/8